jgi:superoxide reductase
MKFTDLLKSAENEGKEKHVPVIEVEGSNSVRVIVGKEVPHPNTVEHHIEWVELYGIKEDDQVVYLGKTAFEPVYADPNVVFNVKVEEFKALCALEYCNLHGVWQNCLEL